MKKKTYVLFKINISDFYPVMKSKLFFFKRDKDEFAKEGITVDKFDVIGRMLDEYNELPTDKELVGNLVISTQHKDELKLVLQNAITVVLNKTANKYGTDSGYYRKFGVNSLSKLDGGELLVAARRVARVGRSMLADLAEVGLTPEMITTLDGAIIDFDNALGLQEDAASNRDIATEERTEKANAIYTLVSKYCDIGKRIWVSKNEARYNDYVIYDTVSVKPDDSSEAKAS